MQKHKVFFYMVLFFLSLSLLSAQERISSLEISGLKRTKIRTILKIIKVKEGDPVTEELVELVEQRLRKTGLFLDEIEVDLVPGTGGQTLKIHVEDKWTLIGLPFFGLTQEKWIAGLFAVDSNLFGTQKLVVTSLMLDQTGGSSAFFLFRDPAFFQTDYQLTATLGGGNSSKKLTDLSGDTLWEDYDKLGINASLGIGIQLNDQINLSGTFKTAVWNNTETLISPPREGELITRFSFSPRFIYDGSYAHALFFSGFVGTLSAAAFWEPLSDLSLSENVSLSYGIVPADPVLIKFFLNQGLSRNRFDSLMLLGGSKGSLTLPGQSIGTSNYVNGEALLEIRLINFGFASITVPLFYEGGYFLDYRSQDQLYHGAGAGIRFYLAKVAAPALGMDFRYSFTSESAGFSAFIGMQF